MAVIPQISQNTIQNQGYMQRGEPVFQASQVCKPTQNDVSFTGNSQDNSWLNYLLGAAILAVGTFIAVRMHKSFSGKSANVQESMVKNQDLKTDVFIPSSNTAKIAPNQNSSAVDLAQMRAKISSLANARKACKQEMKALQRGSEARIAKKQELQKISKELSALAWKECSVSIGSSLANLPSQICCKPATAV